LHACVTGSSMRAICARVARKRFIAARADIRRVHWRGVAGWRRVRDLGCWLVGRVSCAGTDGVAHADLLHADWVVGLHAYLLYYAAHTRDGMESARKPCEYIYHRSDVGG